MPTDERGETTPYRLMLRGGQPLGLGSSFDQTSLTAKM